MNPRRRVPVSDPTIICEKIIGNEPVRSPHCDLDRHSCRHPHDLIPTAMKVAPKRIGVPFPPSLRCVRSIGASATCVIHSTSPPAFTPSCWPSGHATPPPRRWYVR